MNNTQHTPGPWRTLPAEKDKEYLRIRRAALGGRYKIANVLATKYKGASRALTLKENAEFRANADLIAAAPELLDALEIVEACGCPIKVSLFDEEGVEGWQWSHPDGRTWECIGAWSGPVPPHPVVQAAIAKAKGGRK